jgi:2-methylcitrate dehydratase
VHGAIASAAVYGALLGASPAQIESAVGMVVSHYVPFRAIRAGHQLSDSKGASAALSAEAAVLCMRRAMAGFVGPQDVFRNPEAIFRLFEPTAGVDAAGVGGAAGAGADPCLVDMTLSNKARWGPGDAPFDLVLSTAGSDFAVMGMHFKIGLYEHQSAGALEGIVNLMVRHPAILRGGPDAIAAMNVVAYEPAYGIIGDPAKMQPTTRQSADHSMAHIVSRMLTKGFDQGVGVDAAGDPCADATWKKVPTPTPAALDNPRLRPGPDPSPKPRRGAALSLVQRCTATGLHMFAHPPCTLHATLTTVIPP